MALVPRREYLLLLLGDILILAASLWVTLALRYLEVPSMELLTTHIVPFLILFAVWIGVFFIAGLYGKHTRLFKSRLLATVLYTQTINVILAALFFFLIEFFGITPKTILAIYLVVSSAGIFAWRTILFSYTKPRAKLKGVLIASGPDAQALADEIQSGHYPFEFECVIDTKQVPPHEIIQQACRVAEEDSLAFLVVDFTDAAFNAALPIIYDAAFQKSRFALVDITELYEEVFDRVPLSFVAYEWVLGNLATSRVYDSLKRVVDVLLGLIAGVISLVFYPFVILAIKMDDGGDIFITQERVGLHQRPIHIKKFRSMSGNDQGEYGGGGKTKLTVTRVGKWLRILRIDELPQIWNILRGDLSFVGPRPELPTLAAHYNARIPYYNARYLATPGLTGWAQIKHDRHPHHGTDVAETKEKLSYDLFYFRHRSFMLDVFVILQTIRIVLTARGS